MSLTPIILISRRIFCKSPASQTLNKSHLAAHSSGATGWTVGGGLVPPISHRDQFSNSSKSDEKEWGGGTVGFINVSRSNKYTCRVMKNCAFKLLNDLENSLHYYPENPGNCISGIPDFKIFPGEHAPGPPRWLAPSVRDCAPPTSTPWRRYRRHKNQAFHTNRY